MWFSDDDRGVTVVVGAVLMLGIFVTAFAVYQVDVVPDQNTQAEFEHHQSIRGDMLTLSDRVELTAQGSPTSLTIQLSPTYPARTFAINAPNPSSTIETGDAREIVVEDEHGSHTFLTRDVRFVPSYNYYLDAPDVVNDLGAVYVEGDGGQAGLGEATLVSSDTVHLVLVQGNYSTTSSVSERLRVLPVDRETTFELEGTTNVSIESDFEGIGDGLPSSVDATYEDGTLTFSGEFDRLRVGVVSFDPDEDDGGIGDPPFDVDEGPGDEDDSEEDEPDDGPIPTIDDVRDESDCDEHPFFGYCRGQIEFEVDWSATSDEYVESATLELVDQGGSVVDVVSYEYGDVTSVDEADELLTDDAQGNWGDEYEVVLTVSDVNGETGVDSVQIVADGE